MSHGQHPGYVREAEDSLRTAMSSAAQDDVVREAIARIDGASAPQLDSFQTAMGREAQIRAVEEVVRSKRAGA